MGNAAELIKNMIFPRRCPLCGDAVRPFGSLICDECSGGFSFIGANCCSACGKQLDGGQGDNRKSARLCSDCAEHAERQSGGIALMNYDDPAKRSMYLFKYSGRREYAAYYAEELVKRKGNAIREFSPDVIIPVPIHRSRRKKRGYNQAGEIAKELGKRLDVKIDGGALIREKNTMAQKYLGAGARRENIGHAIRAAKRLPAGTRVLLTDDIYTTGSTVRACAKALAAAGAAEVFSCVVCIGRDI